VADSVRIRASLGWAPRYDDLTTIVEHALQWENRRAGVKSAALATGR
jgi:UDP-glucose 4-epimerase